MKEGCRKRAEELVDRMTVQEMCSQLLHQSSAIPRLGIPAYNWWNEGLHGAARSGTATVFPQSIALAATFDVDLVREVADIVSTEQRAKYNAYSALGDRGIYKGLTVWSPNINIFRDPRWGRGQETYGEDPYLTSRMAVAFITGLQGDESILKTASCVKHFVAHSGPEAVRHHFNAVVSPKDLEETYLPAFKAAVCEAHVNAVMGAYTMLNGEPTCAHPLLKQKLRDEWKFSGMVISDCWAVRDFHQGHHVTQTPEQSAALALNRGCDLNCGCTYEYLYRAYQKRLVTKNAIKEACIRAFSTRFELGMFDEKTPYDDLSVDEIDSDVHASKALEAARESIVLLENKNHFLPLCVSTMHSIAVIGPTADNRTVLLGNYHGTPSKEVTFLEGIREACPGVRIRYSQGCALDKDRVERLGEPDDRLAEAVFMARTSDLVLLFLGLDETVEGEMHDDGNGGIAGDKGLTLPPCQHKLLKYVAETGKPIVVVLSSGSSIDPETRSYDNIRAVLATWYPGQAGGTALAEVLVGAVNPSGHLPVTFYRSDAELPVFEDYSMRNRTYRYYQGKTLYPFGHGLSYTEFACSDLRAEPTGDGVDVGLMVANIGKMAGDTIVFVTLTARDNDIPLHPFLAGFSRVRLDSGEEQRLSFHIDKGQFTVVREDGRRETLSGVWTVRAGLHVDEAHDALVAGVEI